MAQGHPPVLARADQVACLVCSVWIYTLQSSCSEVEDLAVLGVVLGCCALFSCTRSLGCALGLAGLGSTGRRRAQWACPSGPLSSVLTHRAPRWMSGREPAAI